MKDTITTRRIFKSPHTSQNEIAEVLQTLFVSELLAPSKKIYLVSPWVSNISIIDNRSGGFTFLNSTWGRRYIRLIEILFRLLELRSKVIIVARPNQHNKKFIFALENLVTESGFLNQIRIEKREKLHIKGLLTDSFYLSGSMNFTYNGVEILEEGLILDTSPRTISEASINFSEAYGR